MLRNQATRSILQLPLQACNISAITTIPQICRISNTSAIQHKSWSLRSTHLQHRSFHSTPYSYAQSPTADALMENLTDLYSTAKDEFEIAAEETEKKTVYAAEDREAAKEALGVLKEAYEKALKESDPTVAKEVQARTGPRIRELENAVIAMEEMAMED